MNSSSEDAIGPAAAALVPPAGGFWADTAYWVGLTVVGVGLTVGLGLSWSPHGWLALAALAVLGPMWVRFIADELRARRDGLRWRLVVGEKGLAEVGPEWWPGSFSSWSASGRRSSGGSGRTRAW